MPRQGKPLVAFDPAAFAYPANLRLGDFHRALSETGLSDRERHARADWVAGLRRRADTPLGCLVGTAFSHRSDDRLLRTTLARHGIFAERFFARCVRERVARAFARQVLELADVQFHVVSDASLEPGWGYAVREGGTASDLIRIVAALLYERAVLRALDSSGSREALEGWIARFAEPRRCVLCGEPFRVIDLPDWAYYGASGYARCCLRCPLVARPEVPRVMELVPAFVQGCGFLPNADASPVCHAFTSRLARTAWPDAIRLWAAMGGTEHVRRRAGSWFRALALSGALPDGVLPTRKGIRCLAHDGHPCHSLEERRIDDYLHARRIPHQREPKYPAHRTLNPSRTRRADWRVGEVFIEYAGLAGDPEYDRKLDEKILLARQSRLDLLVLYPADLERLAQRLDALS